jgi:hypothetical protein
MFSKEVDDYYKQQEKKIGSKIKIKEKTNIDLLQDNDNNYIIKINNNDKNEFMAIYEIIGVFDLHNSVWQWAWNIDRIDRSLVKISDKIKKFPHFIIKNKKQFTPIEADDIYFRTNNGYFQTETQNIHKMIPWILYITKGEWIIPVCIGEDGSVKECTFDKANINANINANIPLKRIDYLIIKDILKIY